MGYCLCFLLSVSNFGLQTIAIAIGSLWIEILKYKCFSYTTLLCKTQNPNLHERPPLSFTIRSPNAKWRRTTTTMKGDQLLCHGELPPFLSFWTLGFNENGIFMTQSLLDRVGHARSISECLELRTPQWAATHPIKKQLSDHIILFCYQLIQLWYFENKIKPC